MLAIYKSNKHEPFLHFRDITSSAYSYSTLKYGETLTFHTPTVSRQLVAARVRSQIYERTSRTRRLSEGVCSKGGRCPVGPVGGVCPGKHLSVKRSFRHRTCCRVDCSAEL